jgi:hypothetical protein
MSGYGDRCDHSTGDALRDWRARRRLSKLELALRAGTTQRHVSFVEAGRSVPGRAMVIRLAESLDVPLREINRLLLAAGYAPAYDDGPLDGPRLGPVRAALDRGAARVRAVPRDDRRQVRRPGLGQGLRDRGPDDRLHALVAEHETMVPERRIGPDRTAAAEVRGGRAAVADRARPLRHRRRRSPARATPGGVPCRRTTRPPP